MIWFLITANVSFYVNRAWDWVKSHAAAIVTALLAVATLVALYSKRSSWTRDTAAEKAAALTRRDLDVLESAHAQAQARSLVLGRQDAVLEARIRILAAEAVRHRVAIAEMEVGRKLDWANMTDEEVDEHFKAAGL